MLMTVKPALDFPFYTFHKPAYTLFMIHLYGGFALVEIILWKEAKKAPPLIRKQLLSLFWGAGLGFIGGQTTVPLVYGYPVFPYGVFFVPIYLISVGYGMLKYQFMDFRLAIRKLGLTLGIYLISLLCFLPLTLPLIRNVLHTPESVKQVFTLSCIFALLLISCT